MRNAEVTFEAAQKLLFHFDSQRDRYCFECLCKYLVVSAEASELRKSYLCLAVKKDYAVPWLNQLKQLLWQSCVYLEQLRSEVVREAKLISVCLSLLVTFTGHSKWSIVRNASHKNSATMKNLADQLVDKLLAFLMQRGLYRCLQTLLMRGLGQSKPSLSQLLLTAVMNVALKPLQLSNYSTSYLTLFIIHLLSVPTLIYHINSMANNSFVAMLKGRLCCRVIDLLKDDKQIQKIVFNGLEGNYALCFIANCIQLALTEMEVLADHAVDFAVVLSLLLDRLRLYVEARRSNRTHFHPVLGWFAQPVDTGLQDSMQCVMRQLQMIWSPKMVKILFADLFDSEVLVAQARGGIDGNLSSVKKKKAKAMSGLSESCSKDTTTLGLQRSAQAACLLYYHCCVALPRLRTDLVSGLSWGDLLPRLWRLIRSIGSSRMWAELLSQPLPLEPSAGHLLYMFAEATTSLLTIMDDVELFENIKAFELVELGELAVFVNETIYQAVVRCPADPNQLLQSSDPFRATLGLLLALYERDCRRRFLCEGRWLIRDLRPSQFLADLEKRRPAALFLLRTAPHVIPHKERILLFRKYVQGEKAALGLVARDSHDSVPAATMIVIHRSRLVEDGYRQLAALPPVKLKGLIRVRFVNDLGLDEAGIDQDGVFKEFLEETLRRVFDPSLNLFSVTSEQKLYPSPTSHLQENHLALFEFVGRMLGKAVYEGIVVDVPFAPFFLSQMLDRQKAATYSFIDELASLDELLYKNLTYVKHYDGDIRDLELTFSYDEDFLGQIVTHDLIEGGRAIAVTNENRIGYVHYMALFRMHRQIYAQAAAFIRGFKSVVNADWLRMFSTPELQTLLSGDGVDMDVEDLKKHVQYYGGFHGKHKVIGWLWDILAREFDCRERQLFLKFVTSCSKPPLLGFAHLEPPFSIRCVEVSEDQDTGDTLGTVLKGFFHIKRQEVSRLPTSSTCFNLLKLPNYAKKSTLRDKLRYAINCNSGFELS